MSARYPFDPFALPERPDVPPPASFERTAATHLSLRGKLRKFLRAIFHAIAIFSVLSVLIFLPALVLEFMRVDKVSVEGRVLSAREFVDGLGSLYIGSSVIALSLMSLIAAGAVVGRGLDGQHGEWARRGVAASSRETRNSPPKSHATGEKVSHV